MSKQIHLWGVKQNNLKNIEVNIPMGALTVVCGPSGSGKSSLAFETLFAEGQRRFIESMSTYARQFLNAAPKPDIEGIENIPPSIAIEQKNSVRNSRSTVGTTTEVVDYLRLLFEKLGQPVCPEHQVPTQKESVTEAASKVINHFAGQRGYLLVEISKEGRIADGKKLHALFLQDGFLRIYVPKKTAKMSTKATTKKSTKEAKEKALWTQEEMGEVVDVSGVGTAKKGLPEDTFYLVIDRLAFSEEERGRIVDSMTLAYEASQKFNLNVIARKASVLTTEGQRLQLSEDNCCPVCGYQPPPLSSKLFSFNSPIGACQSCKGFGNILQLDPKKVIPNPKLSIAQGALNPFTMPSASDDRRALISYCRKAKIDVDQPWEDLPEVHQKAIWNGNKDFFGVKGLFDYLEEKKYKMHVRVFISRYRSPERCPDCMGSRLNRDVHHIYFKNYTLPQLCDMTIEEFSKLFAKFELSEFERKMAGEIFNQIRSRMNFLMRVGVHYLTLSRETRTLSGGEYQRLVLAHQLGMGLSQTLYVLDEPTIGLHPRDNDRLISILRDLKSLGNTLVIVEHDHDVIKSSDYIIEMGPGSGHLGGEVVFNGVISEFLKSPKSQTASFIKKEKVRYTKPTTRPVDIKTFKYKVTLEGAKGFNLKNVTLNLPLNRLVAITGVSGSGKSTLITKTLFPALTRALDIEYEQTQPYESLIGAEHLKNVVLIDQAAIGKSARSNPITYMKAFDHIRAIFSSVSEAKAKGYGPGFFSLNVDGGRCPACKGTGVEEVDMMFMDNVLLPCEICDGKKYRDEALDIIYNGKTINDILAMTVDEGMEFFVNHPNIRRPLSLLKEVGLEYIRLGQPASSLSGGESQRLKIARELSQISQKATLYILDEPTTGLHFREIDLLMKVLNKLIDAGGSVVVVEHNLDVIKGADYIIDLGPDAGNLGGEIVAQGTVDDVMKTDNSLTGKYLRTYLD